MAADQSILSDQQEMFCQEFIVDFNAKQAAIKAGYSEKTAASQASRLLTNVNVSNRIADLLEKRIKRTGITQDYVLQQAVKIHERCMQEVAPFILRGDHVKDGDGNPLYVFDAKSATASLKLIGEHVEVQAFRKVVGVGNPDGSNLNLSDTEIAAKVASMMATAQARKEKDV